MGCFPADNPDYVILILADEPSGGSYYGSIVATPYAKLIIEDIIDYKNYKPSNLSELENNLEDEKIAMPNVIGKSVYEAESEIEGLGLQVEIEGVGKTIVDQFPYEGYEVIKNGIVVIKTE